MTKILVVWFKGKTKKIVILSNKFLFNNGMKKRLQEKFLPCHLQESPVCNVIRNIIVSCFLLFHLFLTSCTNSSSELLPKSYDIVWDTPSKDALESMPLSGRNGAGANIWVQDGSIWLYLAHNGAYDSQGRLLKLGCVRLTPEGIDLGGPGFYQKLTPATGTIDVGQNNFNVSLWFSGETLVVESKSKEPQSYKVSFATWRDEKRSGILQDMHQTKGEYDQDHVLALDEGVVWYHKNADNPVNLKEIAASQGIPATAIADVTSNRIFGGAMAVNGGISQPTTSNVQWQNWTGKAWSGVSAVSKEHRIAIRLAAAQDANPKSWQNEAKSLLDNTAIKSAKKKELELWETFWSRSHLIINQGADDTDAGFLVGRNYQLFRYMLACNRGGELPLLFNGGIFTVDNIPGRITGNNNEELPITETGIYTPDFRRWMYCHFMSQNQRWLGWPAIAGGDAALLEPTIKFYRDRSATASARAKTNGAEGVVYPEPMDVWGLCCVAPLSNGLCGAEHLTYHFSMMLEHAWMALQGHDILGTGIADDLPWIGGVVRFYDSYYRMQNLKRSGQELDNNGKLVIYPSNGLEYAGDATDPVEVVCGLKRVTEALLSLKEVSVELRADLERIQVTIPEIPVGTRDGKESILPAKSFTKEYNLWEPIEMYAAWPYKEVGIAHPETLPLLRQTWETIPETRARYCKKDYSWMANVANMAALAWPEEAEKRAIYKMANIEAPQSRFPAFFGPGHDWLPDHNWGGSGMVGIQEMLMSANPYGGEKIHLLYAWPLKWDVDFKLYAPQQTIISAKVEHGKVVELKVTPESRKKDIVIDPRFL